MSEDMSERMSERLSEDMSARMSEDVSERMSEDVSERMSEDMSEQISESDKLRNRLNADMKALQMDSFDHNLNIHVQFTSNHEDYMHRGGRCCKRNV